MLILGGPFVDVNNEDIMKGEVLLEHNGETKCLEFKDLYQTIFSYLEKELSSFNIQIMIVPSLKDVQNLFPLPQPVFRDVLFKDLSPDFKRKVHFASNP